MRSSPLNDRQSIHDCFGQLRWSSYNQDMVMITLEAPKQLAAKIEPIRLERNYQP
jgi:hypothetical protein